MSAPAPAARILRGYGPLLAFALLFCLMAAFVPTVGDEVRTVPAEAIAAGPGSAADDAAGGQQDAGPAGSLPAGGSVAGGASGASRPGGPAGGAGGGGSGTAGGPQGTTSGQPVSGGGPEAASIRPCPNRPAQVQGDPYSPPCVVFSGDNGGATGRGVTGDKVLISVRMFDFPELNIGPEDGPQTTFAIDKEELKNTVAGLTEYFNTRFQFYGRKLAGPGLTPETFEAGLHAYPGGTGPAGTWRFTPGRYGPVQDGREIYWDRDRTSALNDKKGAYVETEPGKRYRPGDWPASDPAVFRGSTG